jgi:hypothetical protein
MKRLIPALLLLVSCGGPTKFIDEKQSYRVDSVTYYPSGVPSVANIDPHWVAHTSFGNFTYYREIKVGDSVDVIIRTVDTTVMGDQVPLRKDTTLFDPIVDHSKIK